MNAYFCNAGVHEVPRQVAGSPGYITEYLCSIVFADKPEQAKALYQPVADAQARGGVKYTQLHARLLELNVERDSGVAASTDPLWNKVPFR